MSGKWPICVHRAREVLHFETFQSDDVANGRVSPNFVECSNADIHDPCFLLFEAAAQKIMLDAVILGFACGKHLLHDSGNCVEEFVCQWCTVPQERCSGHFNHQAFMLMLIPFTRGEGELNVWP